MESQPDSAFLLLKDIDRSVLKSQKFEAKYALLMSSALDKNYIDICSDSLISRAVSYYSKHGNHKEKMISWYYQGICLKNAGYLIPSMLAFEKAEDEATQLKDWRYLGLICRNRAALFNKSNHLAGAIENWNKAISYFEQAKEPVYKAYAELSLATDYANEMRYDQADSLISNLEVSFPSDPSIRAHCSLRKAEILVQKETEPDKAIRLFLAVPPDRWSILDYGYIAQAYEMLGKRDSADCWLSEGYGLCHAETEMASLDYLKAFIEKQRGNEGSAFLLVNHAASVQDSLTRVLLRQSMSGALADYYKGESASRGEQILKMKEHVFFGAMVGLFLVTILGMSFLVSSQKKDRLLQTRMARLVLREHELERVRQENAHLVGSLFSEKVDHLDKLCETYFRLEDGQQKELAFNHVKELAAKIRNDEALFFSLEKDLNRYCHDIMAKLRVQVPKIKGENIKMIMLFYAGFSYEVVYIIMNKNSVESLKTVRSRFRRKILSEFFTLMYL